MDTIAAFFKFFVFLQQVFHDHKFDDKFKNGNWVGSQSLGNESYACSKQ